MSKWVKKKLKYNPGEKSLKAPFAIYYLDLECLLEKEQQHQNNNLESHAQRRKLSMKLLVGQCLQDVHLMKNKINLIEKKIVLKNCVKSKRACNGNN